VLYSFYDRILDLGFIPINVDVTILCKERILCYKREERGVSKTLRNIVESLLGEMISLVRYSPFY
jgi:hypothetical protein